ncbi:NAD(P)-binding protein, partial [Aureobasidium melanogenum]
MPDISNVAVLGASGNFGTPITSALVAAGFNVTIITRLSSTTIHTFDVPTLRIDYTPETLTQAFTNQDAIAMKKFPMMGFDVQNHKAIIYDKGTEKFTGTILQGIGQAVVGTLQNSEATANRFLKVQSIQTCQNELLEAFEKVTEEKWEITRTESQELIESGKADFATGAGLWRLKLAVATLYDVGQGRGRVASSRKESDAELLGVKDETADEIVAKLLQ